MSWIAYQFLVQRWLLLMIKKAVCILKRIAFWHPGTLLDEYCLWGKPSTGWFGIHVVKCQACFWNLLSESCHHKHVTICAHSASGTTRQHKQVVLVKLRLAVKEQPVCRIKNPPWVANVAKPSGSWMETESNPGPPKRQCCVDHGRSGLREGTRPTWWNPRAISYAPTPRFWCQSSLCQRSPLRKTSLVKWRIIKGR